jgi:hypothetical protein
MFLSKFRAVRSLSALCVLASAWLPSALSRAPSASAQEELDPAWGESPYASPSRLTRHMFGGVDLGVPVILDTDRDLVRPGVNLHVQGGVDFEYIAAFIHGGFRWVPLDFENASDTAHPEYEGIERSPLKNGYFGLGLRLQLPNRSRVLPYVSSSFDFNFWNFHEDELVCTGYYYWWCAEKDVYRFTPGFSGRAGVAVQLRGSLYIDVGAGLSMSFEGDFFDRNEKWVEPYLGITQRL